MKRRILTLMTMVVLSFALPSFAHESRPAYLEITETQPGQYDVLWKRPMRGDRVLGLHPRFPSHCRAITPAAYYNSPGASLERQSLDCGESGIIGKTIRVDGLSTTLTDVLARIAFLDGYTQTTLIRPSDPSFVIEGSQSTVQVSRQYLVLGIEHILGGIDHLLFVLGLLLIVRGFGLLLKTITAFTIAHSITLAMATLGFVNVPQAPVEAVIALSILFLATELIKQQKGNSGLTARYPWVVALSFGLLHGFGFAGALSEVGLPQTDIPLALLFFNIGVEIGQLMFVAAVLLVRWLVQKMKFRWPAWTKQMPAYAIGSLAAFWFIQRTVSFW
jgi:hydrogenase/urease accessory protein HupE